jgi:hypothetical protein
MKGKIFYVPISEAALVTILHRSVFEVSSLVTEKLQRWLK